MFSGIYTRFYLSLLASVLNIFLYITISFSVYPSTVFWFFLPITLFIVYLSFFIIRLELIFKVEVLDSIYREFDSERGKGKDIDIIATSVYKDLAADLDTNRFWLGTQFRLREAYKITAIALISPLVLGIIILVLLK
jgi:hypothetical protein